MTITLTIDGKPHPVNIAPNRAAGDPGEALAFTDAYDLLTTWTASLSGCRLYTFLGDEEDGIPHPLEAVWIGDAGRLARATITPLHDGVDVINLYPLHEFTQLDGIEYATERVAPDEDELMAQFRVASALEDEAVVSLSAARAVYDQRNAATAELLARLQVRGLSASL